MDFTPEDERLIKEKWEELLQSCTKICKNDEDWEFIKRAFFLAKEAHGGVRRRSGEPYLLHPIAVAKIVVDEIGLGVKSVVAALLHDVVEDTEYTVEDMERIFGPKIAKMVDGLTKMSGVFNADTSEQAEYFRKVLLTLSDDVRVILIKIADRLHNMRTLGSMPTNKQIKITGETLYLFAPLAYRLGLYTIKSELEDLCMKYRFPVQYAELSENSKRPKNSAKPSSANSTPRSSKRSSGTISTSKFRDVSKAFTRSGARCSANRFPSRRFTTCSPSGSSSSRCRSPRKRHSAGRYSRLSPTSIRRNRIACATGFRCPRPTATKRCTRLLWVPTEYG